MHILVAEDDQVTRELWASMLTTHGHSVLCCSDGEIALSILSTSPNRFDLLLTDIIMPNMDGRDLVKTLRSKKEHEKLPIIITSSIIGPKEILHLLEIGATYFLQKPIAEDQLMELVTRCQRN